MRHAIDGYPIPDEHFDGIRVVYDNGAELLTFRSQDEARLGAEQRLTDWAVLHSGLPEEPKGQRVDAIDDLPLDTIELIMDGVTSLWQVTDD